MPIQITTEQVKKLRDSTGISIMQCRKALEEAGGDMNKALAILKKNSSEIAEKKGGREVKDGRVLVKMTDLPAQAGNKAVLAALHCETDFVAKNEDFVALLNSLAEKAFAEGVENMKSGAKEMIDAIIQKTGENIQLGEVYEVEGAVLDNYVHNNKIGVIVSLEGGTKELAKDIAMHIAAMKPEYLSAEEITDEAKKTMREVFEKEVAGSDKPADIKKKMLDGKMDTYFKERTLPEQAFIKNGDITVCKLLAEAGAKIKEVKRYSI